MVKKISYNFLKISRRRRPLLLFAELLPFGVRFAQNQRSTCEAEVIMRT